MTKSSLTRRSGTAAAVVFAFALASASVAWGCASIQPKLFSSQGPSGPAGSQVTITGRDFAPGPVEVRWNSRTGELLAQTMGPSFSVSVKIPDAAAVGVHHIMAIPTAGAWQTMSFEVTRSPTASPAGSGPTSTRSTTSGGEADSSTSNSTEQRTDTGNSTATSGDNTDSNTGSTATESASGSSGSEAAPAVTKGAVTAAKGPATTGSGATATPVTQGQASTASSNAAVVTTPAGQAVFGGSVATVTTDTPSAATVSGDTWSGFATTTKPSLLSDGGVATNSSAPSSAPAVGIGLLGAGLVALLAGFGAAESARKRALAGTVAH